MEFITFVTWAKKNLGKELESYFYFDLLFARVDKASLYCIVIKTMYVSLYDIQHATQKVFSKIFFRKKLLIYKFF